MDLRILADLRSPIKEYDSARAATLANRAIEKGVDLLKTLEAMVEAIREVGEGFGRGELFLPELMGAAESMQSAMPIS